MRRRQLDHNMHLIISRRGKYLSNRVVLRRTSIVEAIVGSNGLSVPIGLADDGLPVALQLQTRPGALPVSISGAWSFVTGPMWHEPV